MKKKIAAVLPPVSAIGKFSKYVLLPVILLVLFNSAEAQHKYVINGKINGLTKDMKVMLRYSPSKGILVKDSAVVKNGVFHMEGTIARPYLVSLTLRTFNPPPEKKMVIGQAVPSLDNQSFYLTADTTTITGNSLASAVVHNPVQAEYLELQNSLWPLQKLNGANNLALYYTKNADSINFYRQKRTAFEKQFYQVYTDFIKRHPDSYVSFDVTQMYGVVIEDPDAFEAMFNALAPDFKQSAEGKGMENNLKMVRKFAIGQPVMDFTQNDMYGKPVSLSSLKGKYILIDFWASWCGPCRMEYPYIHKAYDQFKNKNFEVIGVSLDDKRDLWVNSIKDNHFDWIEVCDLKGRKNDVAVAYGITAIPQSLLVDPNGIIIAKNLRGDDLIEKLKEVIKTNK
jgi:thiol-disulfide isomerase/thioredoxin